MDGLWLIHFTGRTFKVTTTNHSSDPQTNLPYPSPTHPSAKLTQQDGRGKTTANLV